MNLMRIKNIDKFFFIKFPTLLIILLPAFMISGAFLTDLSISLCALVFLINCIKNKLYHYFDNWFIKLFFFFWLIIVCSSLLSLNILNSLKSSFFYFRFLLFALCFWYLLDVDKILIKKIFYLLLICFFGLFIDSLFQFYFDTNIFNIKKYHHLRVSSFFGDELILGSYISRMYPIFLAFSFYLHNKENFFKNKIIYTIFFYFLFFCTSLIILLSGERTALFLFFLSSMYIIVQIKPVFTKHIKFIILFILFIFFIFSIENIKKRFVKDTISLFNQNKIIEGPSISSNTHENDKPFFLFSKQHSDHYISAYRMFITDKIFGVGPRNFRFLCNDPRYYVSEFSCSTHPHNTFLQLLAETGVLGTFFFLLLILLFFFYSLKHAYLRYFKGIVYFNNFQICILASILISISIVNPSGNFFNNWLSSVYFYPIGIFFWSLNVNNQNSKEKVLY